MVWGNFPSRENRINKDAQRRAGTPRSPPAGGERRRFVASPSRLSRRNSGTHNPEAESDAPIDGIIVATIRRTSVRRRSEPTPAA